MPCFNGNHEREWASLAIDAQADPALRESWNYRVIALKQNDVVRQEIRAVYYRSGRPTGFDCDAAVVSWVEADGGIRILDRMREALTKPTLCESDFGMNRDDFLAATCGHNC